MTVTPPATTDDSQRQRMERMARWLDSAVAVPGTSIRLGLDALIGLIPGIGDVAGFVIGLWFILQARKLDAPGHLQGRMLGNLALEAVVGSIPLIGDLFDVAWQANQRNRKLLFDWLDRTAPAPEPAVAGAVRRMWPGLLVLCGLAGAATWWISTQ